MALDIHRIGAIPSMGGDKVATELYMGTCRVAEAMADAGGGYIVECGAWLGSCTVSVACGLRDYDELAAHEGRRPCNCQMVVYDKWTATASEVLKAHRQQGMLIPPGTNLLPAFLENVGGIYHDLRTIRGDTQLAEWNADDRIYLYIDDCNKRPTAWEHATRTFFPAFVPGETLLYLMDIDYYKKFPEGPERSALKCQKRYMRAHREQFKLLQHLPGTTGRVYLFTG